MSWNEVTTDVIAPVSPSRTGSAFTINQRRLPPGGTTPISTSWQASPVSKARPSGISAKGMGEPSPRKGCHCDRSSVFWSSSRLAPKKRSAFRLQAFRRRSTPTTRMPSSSAETMDRYWASPSRSASSDWRRCVMSACLTTAPPAAARKGTTLMSNQRCPSGESQGYSSVNKLRSPANTASIPSATLMACSRPGPVTALQTAR